MKVKVTELKSDTISLRFKFQLRYGEMYYSRWSINAHIWLWALCNECMGQANIAWCWVGRRVEWALWGISVVIKHRLKLKCQAVVGGLHHLHHHRTIICMNNEASACVGWTYLVSHGGWANAFAVGVMRQFKRPSTKGR